MNKENLFPDIVSKEQKETGQKLWKFAQKSLQKWKLYKQQPLPYFNSHSAPRPIVKKKIPVDVSASLDHLLDQLAMVVALPPFVNLDLMLKCFRDLKGKLLFGL